MDFGNLKFTVPGFGPIMLYISIIVVPLSRFLDMSIDRIGYSPITIDIWSRDNISRAFFIIVVTFNSIISFCGNILYHFACNEI